MNLLEFLEDPRGPEQKGRVLIVGKHGTPFLAVRIPPRRKRIVLVPVLQKSSETQGE
ncbi:MAG TPA: hypothetical protein VEO20_02755 [Thermoplasmata archaeon]|nr:hypothetical protein [Thermoplasmata archaeon]